MDWFVVSPILLLELFSVSVVAAFIDSIAGGGGLITLPMLLTSGMSPAQALATNKLQGIGSSFSSSFYFFQHNAVNINDQKLNIIMAFSGSIIGSMLIQYLNTEILRQLLPLMLMTIGMYFLFMPTRIEYGKKIFHCNKISFALISGGCIGFYDGFFGPGAGSFYALVFIMLQGYNLSKATAHAKVLNFSSDIGGVLFFIFSQKIVWGTGLIMLLGSMIGARMGAGLVLGRKKFFIRPIIVTFSFILSSKLLYDAYYIEIISFSHKLFHH